MAKKEVTGWKNPERIKRTRLSLILFLIIAFLFLTSFFYFDNKCGDGTANKECSYKKPYFCLNKNLIKKPSFCGCPGTLILEEGDCVSSYTTQPENRKFEYVLRGEKDEINFAVYKGFVDYLSSADRFSEGDSRGEFELSLINNEEQRDLLLPLVAGIQNKTSDRTDQMRIAVSLVQNILYVPSDKNVTLRYKKINYQRYPYEVLYDKEGICGEKSELLAFLLKELGYGVALFYYSSENHEAVGIKCPDKFSLNNTGYCFIETSGPSIISNTENIYSDGISLSSNPELIPISDGDSLNRNLYEFKDAPYWVKLNKILEEKGEFNLFRYHDWNKIREKYGL